MGYLSNADDVFISYARIDDQTHLDEEKGWVAYLQAELEKLITELLGVKNISIWRDPALRGNDYYEPEILARVARAATLISIISPGFSHSDWCLKELKKFADVTETGSEDQPEEERSRIFKVEKLPVDRSSLPDPLPRISGYRFYKQNPERPGHVYEFRPQLGKRDKEDYWQRCNDLAHDIVAVLQELAEKAAGRASSEAARPAVYLAVTTEDMEDKANEIRRDLKSRHFRVLPAGNLPTRLRDLQTEVRDALAKCVLSIHLVGNGYGSIPEGETEKSVAWLQNQLAIERSRDPDFVRLIWMPPDLKPADRRQQDFVNYLRNDSEAQQGATDVLEGKIEDLKTTIQENLQRIEEKKTAPKTAPAAARTAQAATTADTPSAPVFITQRPKRIYIVCDHLDLKSDGLVTLKKYLLSQKCQPLLPSEMDDEGEALKEHEENMELCDACLIYYGQGSVKWFNQKIRDLRRRSVATKGIYIAPPENDDKRDFETLEALVIRCPAEFDKNALTEFLSQLQPAQQR